MFSSHQNPVFNQVIALLDPYYLLVEKINALHTLQEGDLESYFDDTLIPQILQVESLYSKTSLKRRCGNPFFVHFFRSLIWAKALGQSLETQRYALYHDVFEDFAYPVDAYLLLREQIPSDLILHLDAVTNKYHLVLKVAKKKGAKTISDFQEILPTLQNEFIPGWNDAIETLHLTCIHHKDVSNSFDFLDDVSYRLYLEDLVVYAKKNELPELLIAKFIDRLDNTITDFSSNYKQIKSLYIKNASMLSLTKEYVSNSTHPVLKLLYYLLFERSRRQIEFIGQQYNHISNNRGYFYGRQFLKLHEEFLEEEKNVLSFESIANELLNDKDVQIFLNTTQ